MNARLGGLAVLAALAVASDATAQSGGQAAEPALAALLRERDGIWVNLQTGASYGTRIVGGMSAAHCRLTLTFRDGDPVASLDVSMRELTGIDVDEAQGLLELRTAQDSDHSLLVRFARDGDLETAARLSRDLARDCGARLAPPPPLIAVDPPR